MGGREGDWRAELDFDNGEAIVKEQTDYGLMEVATVPLGEWVPETDEYEAALNPDCPQAQRLMKIVFAPEAWALLTSIRDELASRCPLEDRGEIRTYQHERQDASLLDEINRVLECLTVPGREDDEPDGFGEDRCKQCGKRSPIGTCPACQQENFRNANEPPAGAYQDDGTWAPTTPSGDPISGDTRPDGPFQSGSGYGGEPR